MTGLVEIGTVRTTHGYAGELKVQVDDAYREDLAAAEFVLVGRDALSALPYKLLGVRGADGVIVRLEGLRYKEESASLRGRILYLRASDVTQRQEPGVNEETTRYARFIGFAVIDDQLGEIGQLEDVVPYPGQVLAKVNYRGEVKLVPLNEHLIKGVDFTKKIVFMNLPDGLMDL